MSALRTWFAGRALREKRLILVMLALLAITIVWAGVIRPVRDGLSSARERHADAVIRLGQTLNEVEAVKSAQRAGIQPLSGALADTVRAKADEAGFALATLDQDGPDRVKISIANARPGALLGWIAGLEQAGILVESTSLTPNGDQTVAAQMTLRGRSA